MRGAVTAGFLAALLTLAGCGGNGGTTTTASHRSHGQGINAAVTTCTQTAQLLVEVQELSGATGSALQVACGNVGDAVRRGLRAGVSAGTKLSTATALCRTSIHQLRSVAIVMAVARAQGQAGHVRAALSGLCDSIESGG